MATDRATVMGRSIRLGRLLALLQDLPREATVVPSLSGNLVVYRPDGAQLGYLDLAAERFELAPAADA